MTKAIDAEFVKFVAAAVKIPEEEIKSLEIFNNPMRKDSTYILTRESVEEGVTYTQKLEIGISVKLYVQGPKEVKQ